MNLHFCSNQDAEDKFEGFRFSQNRTKNIRLRWGLKLVLSALFMVSRYFPRSFLIGSNQRPIRHRLKPHLRHNLFNQAIFG